MKYIFTVLTIIFTYNSMIIPSEQRLSLVNKAVDTATSIVTDNKFWFGILGIAVTNFITYNNGKNELQLCKKENELRIQQKENDFQICQTHYTHAYLIAEERKEYLKKLEKITQHVIQTVHTHVESENEKDKTVQDKVKRFLDAHPCFSAYFDDSVDTSSVTFDPHTKRKLNTASFTAANNIMSNTSQDVLKIIQRTLTPAPVDTLPSVAPDALKIIQRTLNAEVIPSAAPAAAHASDGDDDTSQP